MLARRMGLIGAVVLLGHVGQGTLAAQSTMPVGTFDVAGFVLAGGSDRPVEGALVHVPEAGIRVLTDANGLFVLRDVEARSYEIEVSVLGYADLVQSVELAPEGVLDVRLLPKPVVLEGLTVVADRMERRMRAVAVAVRVVRGAELKTSPYRDAREFLLNRMGAILQECGVRVIGFPDCIRVRGRARPVRLYVDDNPLPGGLAWLGTYRPHDLERFEYMPTIGQVRIYTTGYIERLASAGRSIEPVCIVCVPG